MRNKTRVSGVYKLTIVSTGEFYIGSSGYIKSRWSLHKYHMRKMKHHIPKIQSAYNESGLDSFVFDIIEECSKDVLYEREQYWMDTLNPSLNISKRSDSNLGLKHSEETKEKLRRLFKGREPSNKGVPHSEKTKSLLKEAWKNRKINFPTKDSTKKKISNSLSGKKKSPEHVDKLKGRKLSESHIKALIIFNTGRKHSDEAIRKMSDHNKIEITKRKRDAFGRIIPKSGIIKDFTPPRLGTKQSKETRDKLKAAWARRKERGTPHWTQMEKHKK